MIRYPYSGRHPLLGHSSSIEDRFRGNRVKGSTAVQQQPPQHRGDPAPETDEESIYHILIKFPPKNEQRLQQNHHQNHHSLARRVPSITMLPEDDPTVPPMRSYPRSLPIVHRTLEEATTAASNEIMSSASATMPSTSRLPPLDTRLVPKQLLHSGMASHSGSLLSVASSGIKRTTAVAAAPVVSGGGGGGAGTKPKKASSEKKQDRKAAKTLSAILLAFIVTWTPYSVLVVINAILGKEKSDSVIPSALWEFSYYLCYINSTVNPMLYALCNAAFRRTYVRILTCRWGSRARQPINRYYYG